MPCLVDDDHRVGNGVEDRAQMRLARQQVLCVAAASDPGATENLSHPGDADADHGEHHRLHDRRGRSAPFTVRRMPSAALSAVARSPGPIPPNPAAIKTAGMKMRKEARPCSQGWRPQASMARSTTAAAAAHNGRPGYWRSPRAPIALDLAASAGLATRPCMANSTLWNQVTPNRIPSTPISQFC